MVDVRDVRGLWRTAGAMSLLCVGAAFVAGCGSGSSGTEPRFAASEQLRPGDFVRDIGSPPNQPTRIADYRPESPRADRVAIRTITEAEAMQGVGAIDTTPDRPLARQGGARDTRGDAGSRAPNVRVVEPADLSLVDAKVGDLNGLPIVAQEWLRPLGPRLRAESVGKSRAEWRFLAQEIINERLNATLQDELFLAEARAQLTEQQRVGLRVFLERFEQEQIRASYGSQTLADERLREVTGGGLEEAKRERERTALIAQVRQSKIIDRVQVTSRDLVLEYERRFEEFNPPPRAMIREIWVPTRDEDAVAYFERELASRPFVEVADDERNRSEEWNVREITGSLAETQFYGPDVLQNAAASLSPGEWAGPLEFGTATYWLYLDRVQDESVSLYDAQASLRDEIFRQRAEQEAKRYLLRLFERAGITNLRELNNRLLVVAEIWFYEGGSGS